MSDADDALPDCLACGACCFSTLPEYVRVSGDDHARLGDEAERVTHFLGHRCYLRIEDGRCAALEVTLEADGVTGRFACRVYPARPALCRELERGSPACRAERHEKAERPRAALVALRARR